MKSALSKQSAHGQHGLSTLEYVILFVIIVVSALALWSKLGRELSVNLDNGAGAFDKPDSVPAALHTPAKDRPAQTTINE